MSQNINEAKRLNFNEFLNRKLDVLDTDHRNAVIKQIEAQKEVDRQKEQVLKLDGAKDHIRRLFREWALYERDTKIIRTKEQQELDKPKDVPTSIKEKIKNKFKKKG